MVDFEEPPHRRALMIIAALVRVALHVVRISPMSTLVGFNTVDESGANDDE